MNADRLYDCMGKSGSAVYSGIGAKIKMRSMIRMLQPKNVGAACTGWYGLHLDGERGFFFGHRMNLAARLAEGTGRLLKNIV